MVDPAPAPANSPPIDRVRPADADADAERTIVELRLLLRTAEDARAGERARILSLIDERVAKWRGALERDGEGHIRNAKFNEAEHIRDLVSFGAHDVPRHDPAAVAQEMAERCVLACRRAGHPVDIADVRQAITEAFAHVQPARVVAGDAS